MVNDETEYEIVIWHGELHQIEGERLRGKWDAIARRTREELDKGNLVNTIRVQDKKNIRESVLGEYLSGAKTGSLN